MEILNAMEVAGLSAGETPSSLSSLGRREDEGRRRDESTTGRRTIERRVRASWRVEILPSRGLLKKRDRKRERERKKKSMVEGPLVCLSRSNLSLASL